MNENEKSPVADREEENGVELSAAARRLNALGQDTVNEHESAFTGRKIGKAENFWYRHRWHAGIIICAAVIICVAVVQLIVNVKPDAYIMYAGPQTFVGSRYTAFEEALEEVLTDFNGDGKIKITMADNTYLSEAQIEEHKRLSGSTLFDYSSNNAAYSRFMVEISAGEHMFCMLDPGLYEQIDKSEGFVPLSEVFPEGVPAAAYGNCGIRLGDTAFYKSHRDLSFIPADTVLAIRAVPETKTGKAAEKAAAEQKNHMELLRAIVSFEAEKEEQS